MSNIRLVIVVIAMMLGIALAMGLLGYVRVPIALIVLSFFGILWAVEVLCVRAATSEREKRP